MNERRPHHLCNVQKLFKISGIALPSMNRSTRPCKTVASLNAVCVELTFLLFRSFKRR
jgi:hypothetical protein